MRKKDSKARKNGLKAHRETIGPSHRICEKVLKRRYPKHLVTSTTGIPDFIIISKNGVPLFVELKPNRLGKYQRASYMSMYLSPIQEKKNLWLIKNGLYSHIVYYNKNGERFYLSDEVKLTRRNIKKFCFSTPWEERTDPDNLFKR